MILGVFRDGHPHATISIRSLNDVIDVDCVIDTGFEGDLALPHGIARRLGPIPDGFTERMLADGSNHRCPFYLITLDSLDGQREAEVLVLGVRPLIGTMFLEGHLLQVEVMEGGDVAAEPL